MSKLNKMLLLARQAAVRKDIYIWSAQGEKVRSLKIGNIIDMEQNEVQACRVLKHIADMVNGGYITKRTRAFDCSGAMCWMLVKAGVEAEGFDTTADGLMRRYKAADLDNITNGDLVFKCNNNGAFHVGLYADGKVYECKGRDYGFIVGAFNSTWNAASRPDYT